MHPVGLDFISVTDDDNGETKRLFISPYESWFGLPSTFNRIVAEWFAAIRAAVVEATAASLATARPSTRRAAGFQCCSPCCCSRSSCAPFLPCCGRTRATRDPSVSRRALATSSACWDWLPRIVLGRVFGDGAIRSVTPRQACYRPSSWWGGAVVRLSFIGPECCSASTVLALGESGAMVGSWVLIGRISVVSVGLVLIGAVVLMASLIHRGRATPLEQLTPLDRPAARDRDQQQKNRSEREKDRPHLAAAGPAPAVPFPPPSPPRASAWPGVVFMIGMACRTGDPGLGPSSYGVSAGRSSAGRHSEAVSSFPEYANHDLTFETTLVWR